MMLFRQRRKNKKTQTERLKEFLILRWPRPTTATEITEYLMGNEVSIEKSQTYAGQNISRLRAKIGVENVLSARKGKGYVLSDEYMVDAMRCSVCGEAIASAPLNSEPGQELEDCDSCPECGRELFDAGIKERNK